MVEAAESKVLNAMDATRVRLYGIRTNEEKPQLANLD